MFALKVSAQKSFEASVYFRVKSFDSIWLVEGLLRGFLCTGAKRIFGDFKDLGDFLGIHKNFGIHNIFSVWETLWQFKVLSEINEVNKFIWKLIKIYRAQNTRNI